MNVLALQPLIITGALTAVFAISALAVAQDDGGAVQEVPPARMDISSAGSAELRREIVSLLEEVTRMRHELAEAKLALTQAQHDLQELQQFMDDHEQYGRDFEQYSALRALREDEARRRRIEEARERREAERNRRAADRAARLADREARRRSQAEEDRYSRAGFGPLGLDVYSSRMAFAYPTTSVDQPYLAYDLCVGFYNARDTRTEIDYSRMTISGSILNADEEVRHLGVAVTFFDENNNQVGHEIVQVRNARPNVPYPFTSTIDMALNRPFHSSSVYVLYADSVNAAGDAEPASTTTTVPDDQP